MLGYRVRRQGDGWIELEVVAQRARMPVLLVLAWPEVWRDPAQLAAAPGARAVGQLRPDPGRHRCRARGGAARRDAGRRRHDGGRGADRDDAAVADAARAPMRSRSGWRRRRSSSSSSAVASRERHADLDRPGAVAGARHPVAARDHPAPRVRGHQRRRRLDLHRRGPRRGRRAAQAAVRGVAERLAHAAAGGVHDGGVVDVDRRPVRAVRRPDQRPGPVRARRAGRRQQPVGLRPRPHVRRQVSLPDALGARGADDLGARRGDRRHPADQQAREGLDPARSAERLRERRGAVRRRLRGVRLRRSRRRPASRSRTSSSTRRSRRCSTAS